MRRRRIIMFFAMIMSVAIIGVGFAAWIITAPTQNEVIEDGTITVEEVQLYGWKFEHQWKDGKNTIVFGKPNESDPDYVAPSNPWLTSDSTTAVQNLTATLNVSAIVQSDDYKGTGLNPEDDSTVAAYVIFELYRKATDGTEEIVTQESVAKYFTISVENAELSPKELSNGTTVVINFKWTTDEKGTNPYIYFNDSKNNKTHEDAFDFLNGLKNVTEGLKFRLTLTTTNPNA